MLKSLIKEVFIILLISVALAFMVNSLRTQGLPLLESESQNLTKNIRGNAAGSYRVKEISVEEAIQGFKKGRFLFADARSENEFNGGHIKPEIHGQFAGRGACRF